MKEKLKQGPREMCIHRILGKNLYHFRIYRLTLKISGKILKATSTSVLHLYAFITMRGVTTYAHAFGINCGY